ncbi:MAG: Coenzyme F420 hydrogenase/dehydrogenase, beta subunit C-terminal domain [Desulfobacterales bacterium]
MRIEGSRKLVQHVQQAGMCISCGACLEICPYFNHYKGQTLQLFPCDLEKGRCYAHCPKIEVDLDELSRRLYGTTYKGLDIGVYRSILAGRAGARMPKGPYQGGGTTSALMAFALASGLIDAAVLTDQKGGWPDPRIVTNEKEVITCALSKFTAAPTLAAFNRAVHQGYQRLGVVGTPCQITALAQLKGNPLEIDDFQDPVALSVGLFCNWALEPRSLMTFLSSLLDISRVKRMDIPPPPADVLIVRMEDRVLEIALKDIRHLIPTTCFICPDLTSEWADLSIGMVEGKVGWNTLIVRTEAGEQIVRQAENAGYLETASMPKENVAHLSDAGRAKKGRAFRTAVRQNAVNADKGRSALHVPDEVIQRLTTNQKSNG